MQPDDPEGLNLRAYLALRGASSDWRDDLALLLRSETPLSREIRDRLADALENRTSEGVRLELFGHKADHDRFLGVVSRHERMEIGRWVHAYKQAGSMEKNATQAAADHFVMGIKKIEAAVTYFNKVSIWIDRAMESDAGQAFGREWLERIFISTTVSSEMRRANRELLRELFLSH